MTKSLAAKATPVGGHKAKLGGQRKARERAKGLRLVDRLTPIELYGAPMLERVNMIREGVSANALVRISRGMQVPKERLYASLRLPRSTMDRKIRDNARLSPEHSEKLLGLERLIGQVERLVAESGNPQDFDAALWLGEWLNSPLPALDGASPGDYMDTMEGQELVATLLAQSQSGAYV